MGGELSDTGKRAGTIQSLVKGLRILGLFSAAEPTKSIAEIIEATGHARATVYRLVKTLESERYLMCNSATGRYSIGPAVVPVLYSLRDPSNLVFTLHPRLQAFADEVGEHVCLSIEVENGPLVIAAASSSISPFRLAVGAGRMDGATSTSQGKIFLAHKPADELKALLALPLARQTLLTTTNPEELKAELEEIRRSGVAFDRGEHIPDLCGVSAPVWDGAGFLVAAVSCLIMADRFTDEKQAWMAEVVRQCGSDMSGMISHQPDPIHS
jgi:DNA-binding IclR family transcriptional regulator